MKRFIPASQVKVGDIICFDTPSSKVLIDRISEARCDGWIGLHGNDDTFSIFLKPTDRIQVLDLSAQIDAYAQRNAAQALGLQIKANPQNAGYF